MFDPILTQASGLTRASWRGVRVVATAAAVLTATALSIIDARAQGYNADDDDDRNGGYEQSSDDGSYLSDRSGGYQNSDDEDGYEDGQDAPDIAYFYDELEDQGEWLSHPDYGQVWRPRGVDRDWRPYTRGTWANTEEHGWYWVSDEKFGWATFHYGRWFLDVDDGWLWVPGTRWGPAWVTWRSSDDHIGWAPLPPEAYWEHGSGLRFETSIYEQERYRPYWSFVEYRYITTPRIYTYCAPRPRLTTIFFGSRPAESYRFVNRRIVNRGVSISRIESVTRTTFTPFRLRASDNRAYRSAKRDRDVLNIYRPKLTRAVIKPRREDRPKFDRGLFRDVDKRRSRGDGRPRSVSLPNGGRDASRDDDRSDRKSSTWPGRGPNIDRDDRGSDDTDRARTVRRPDANKSNEKDRYRELKRTAPRTNPNFGLVPNPAAKRETVNPKVRANPGRGRDDDDRGGRRPDRPEQADRPEKPKRDAPHQDRAPQGAGTTFTPGTPIKAAGRADGKAAGDGEGNRDSKGRGGRDNDD